jgi:hypothetical protein
MAPWLRRDRDMLAVPRLAVELDDAWEPTRVFVSLSIAAEYGDPALEAGVDFAWRRPRPGGLALVVTPFYVRFRFRWRAAEWRAAEWH